MTKGSSLILRIYFAVVSAVTLFTLMFGAIDLLAIGLRQVIPGADRPEWGLEDCSITSQRYVEDKSLASPTNPNTEATPEETKAACEARNADAELRWQAQQASQAVRNIALVIISLPLFVIHFRIVYRDWQEERKS